MDRYPSFQGTGIPTNAVLDRCLTVETHARYSVEHRIQSSLVTRMPVTLYERPTVRNFTSPGTCNKIFASEWYDGNRVLLVTKCNQILLLDIITGKFTPIAIPKREPRGFSTQNIGWGNCGKHCLAFNQERTMFATGGTDPADVIIIDAFKMEPKVCLVGHRDWIFGVAWVSETHVVSASRDCSVGLWNVESEAGRIPSLDPRFLESSVIRYHENDEGCNAVFNTDFSARARDVRFCHESQQLAVLTSDGGIKMLDPFRHLAKIKSFYLPDSSEPVCMALQPNKICVGCKSHANLIDPRVRTLRHQVARFASPDGQCGIRSIEMKGNLLSYGTGKASLIFHDVRYVDPSRGVMTFEDRSCCGMLKSSIQAHAELQPSAYIYPGSSISHAIYSHKWDHSGTRLFFCGGPIVCGVDGHMCGLYD